MHHFKDITPKPHLAFSNYYLVTLRGTVIRSPILKDKHFADMANYYLKNFI